MPGFVASSSHQSTSGTLQTFDQVSISHSFRINVGFSRRSSSTMMQEAIAWRARAMLTFHDGGLLHENETCCLALGTDSYIGKVILAL